MHHEKPRLVHVVNSLAAGAIPHILRDLQPELAQHYQVMIVSLEPIIVWDQNLEKLRQDGAHIVSLDCSRRNIALQFWRLRRILHECKPHIAHGHLGRAEVLTPLCAPQTCFTVATYHTMQVGHRLLTRLLACLSNRLLNIRLFVSHAVAASWQGTAYNSAHVIYNPVQIDNFWPDTVSRQNLRKQLRIAEETQVFLNIGRLIPAKGQSDLLHAAALMKNNGINNFIIVIAGDGKSQKKLQNLTKTLGIEDKIRFLGHRSDINALLSSADAFVFPSHFEGLGLAPIEAMAHGLPVIAADFTAGREFIFSGVTGHVFPAGDYAALAVLMTKFMTQPNIFTACCEQAKHRAIEKFSVKTVAQHYFKIYEQRQ